MIENSEVLELISGISEYVRDNSGIQLRGKDELIQSRVSGRLHALGLSSPAEYLKYLKDNQLTEISYLISALTTHKTEFFREAEHFDYLFQHVFPQLILSDQPVTVWSAACSSGEEVFSLAISFLEFTRTMTGLTTPVPRFRFLGTDIDAKSIETAQDGVYPLSAVQNLQPDLVERYFDVGVGPLSNWVRVKDEVWNLCEFKEMNLLETKDVGPNIKITLARNLFIYFLPEMIDKALHNIYELVDVDSLLFLGFSESLNGTQHLFTPLGKSIYKKLAPQPLPELRSPIQTLIVDDSATIRRLLTRILRTDPAFEIAGEAANPIEAESILKLKKIDLITLDIEMPEMDGVTYLEKIQGRPHPPIVMISTLKFEQAGRGLRCFELGAIDYIEKPTNFESTTKKEEILSVLRGAASSQLILADPRRFEDRVQYNERATEIGKTASSNAASIDPPEIIAIGASAGGPLALQNVLSQFPKNSPPVLIVQHLPKLFEVAFAKKLSENCPLQVVVGIHGTKLAKGYAYLAPSGAHMKVVQRSGELSLSIIDEPQPTQHCPSVDALFYSLSKLDPEVRISAALLTGMGKDGAQGLLELRKRGAFTIAQDAETCVVFGMPKAAIELGAAAAIVPIQRVAGGLFGGLTALKEASSKLVFS